MAIGDAQYDGLAALGFNVGTLQERQLAYANAGFSSPFVGSSYAPLDRDIIFYGDSRTANGFSGTAPDDILENYGYATHVVSFTNGMARSTKARNAGVGGDTTAMWLARMPSVLSMNGKICVVLISTNDRGNSITLDKSQRNLESGIRRLLLAGLIPIVIAETPRGPSKALTGQNLINHFAMRDWIKSFFPTIGVAVADPWVDMISDDPAKAALGYPKDNLLHDDLHPNNNGAMIIGYHVAQCVSRLFKNKGWLSTFESSYDATNNVTGSLNSNAMLVGTTGSKGGSANAVGDVATGYNLLGSSWTGASVQAFKMPNPAGGEFQCFTLSGTPTGTGSYLTFEQSITLSQLTTGDVIKGVSTVNMYNVTGVAGVSTDMRFVRSGAAQFAKFSDRYLETTPMIVDKREGLYYETPQITYSSATDTEIKYRFVVYGCQNTPMTGTVMIGQHSLNKVIA